MPLKKGKSSQIISKNIQKLKKKKNPIGRLWPLHYKQQKQEKRTEKAKNRYYIINCKFCYALPRWYKKKKNNEEKGGKKKLLKGNGKNKQANRPRTVCSCKSCS